MTPAGMIAAVTGWYATTVMVAGLVVALWAAARLIAGRPPGRLLELAAWLVEILVVVFAAGGIWQVLHEPRDFAKVEFVLYLLALVALIPVALWWMRGEVSRGASAVLLVVMLVVPFLVVRAQQIWAGTHG